MSVQDGAWRAIARGEKVGCTALQIFTRNNVQWHAKPLAEADAARFHEAWDASPIGPIVAHANYLIDLGSPDERIARLSLEGLIVDIRRSAALRLSWVVLHPGFHKGAGEEAGLRRIADLGRRALDATADLPVGILLETTAGQGTCLGHRFEHLAELLAAIGQPDRTGVCFDTAHTFAAGYDLGTARGYRAVMREFDAVVGLDQIRAFHLNDSKRDLGSRVDRHAHIGRGHIGLDAFRCLLRDRRFAKIPKLLETPKEDDERKDWDSVNLATLRGLV